MVTFEMVLASMLALAGLGCEGQLVGETTARASWTLVADESLALRDPRCTGEVCPAYPNPSECEELDVTIDARGRVCGRCGSEEPRCGGPASGVPYRCRVDASAGCMVCDDIFGTNVLRHCGREIASDYGLGGRSPAPGDSPVAPAPGGDPAGDASGEACFDASRSDGSPCSVCFSAAGDLIEDTCTAPSNEPGSGDLPPVDVAEAPSDGSCPGPEEGWLQGRAAFARELNAILTDAALPADYVPGSVDRPADALLGAYRFGVICEPPFDTIGDDRRWYRDGQPRCGYMAQAALSRTCGSPSATCARFEDGVLGEMAHATVVLGQRYDCIASPIVIDVDGDGIRSVRGDARFDLAGSGVATATSWIAPGDALLAMDRDGDGRIRDGRELFGDTTVGRGARLAGDGFTALAALDADGDGDVDAADPAWDALRLWRDDGDGRSEPGELFTPAAAGLVRFHNHAVRSSARDEAGSILGLWGRFDRKDGRTGLACDVWFADTE